MITKTEVCERLKVQVDVQNKITDHEIAKTEIFNKSKSRLAFLSYSSWKKMRNFLIPLTKKLTRV